MKPDSFINPNTVRSSIVQEIRDSLRRLKVEAVITTAVLAMPIMTEFYLNIGMNYAQIGLSQAIFTIAVLMLNVPTGWLADRFSRKWCNVAGDSLAAVGFVGYAFAQSFADVIIAEIIIGIGMAFSNGADIALLRAYCRRLMEQFEKHWAQVTTWQPLVQIVAVIAGGVIGTHSPRLVILLSAVPFAIGALLSLSIKEAGERRVSEHNPFKDMAIITRYALHGHKRLAWTILATATAREITHPVIWLLTPLLLAAGVPVAALGLGWAANLLAVSAGARTAGLVAQKLSEWQRFAAPAVAALAVMLLLGTSLSMMTVILYAVFGFSRGWYMAVMSPMIQAHTPDDIQSTVVSVAGSVSQLLYIPLVWGLGVLADISLSTALYGSFAVFGPLVLLSAFKLRQYEGR